MEEWVVPRRNTRSVWRNTRGTIYVSALLDLAVLQAFVSVNMVAWWVPLAHTLAVVGGCLIYEGVVRTGWSANVPAATVTPFQVIAGLCVEGGFMLLAPGARSYFVGGVFYIFALAGLILRRRDAVITLGLATAALIATCLPQPDGISHHWTAAQRVVVSLGMAVNLARCTWIALWGTRLRGRMVERQRQRRIALSQELHEELGQQLAGVSLMLSAVATRLGREAHPVAPEIKQAATQLGTTIAKVRALSAAIRPTALGRPSSTP